jgi:nicotinamidase-related amidase
MPLPSLAELVDPSGCVLVTQEVQEGVVGATAGLPALAEEARREALPNIARLVAGARCAGVPVVHCVIEGRADGKGSGENCRLFQLGRRFPVDLTLGGPGAALLPETGLEADDLVLTRSTGLGPMGGTDLDAVLRNLGARVVVGVGVSVNVAIPNFVMDAVNRGYWFVLPRDAVAGVPTDYATAVIDNTLSLLAHVTTTDEVLAAWSSIG